MARAKRTDRSEARRRYRATQSEVQEATDAGAEEAAETPAPPSATRQSAARASTAPRAAAARASTPARPTLPPGERPSFTAAFRAAARPFDVRSDIAYIPTLVLRTRAVWIPAAAAVASGALFLASQPLGSNALANLAFQLFVLPPTIAGSFVAGILAPRATYVAGGIAALIGAVVFAFAVAVTPVDLSTATIPSASPTPGASASSSGSAAPAPSAQGSTTTNTLSDADKVGAILQSVALSVPFGVAIGAFGGYYKRFLSLSNPGRQRRAAEQQRQKSQRQQPGKRRY